MPKTNSSLEWVKHGFAEWVKHGFALPLTVTILQIRRGNRNNLGIISHYKHILRPTIRAVSLRRF